MKRKILLSILPLSGLLCLAQESSAPVVVENMMSYQISPNGQWIRSNKGGSTIYNTVTDQLTDIGNIDLGTGNCISNNGSVVGSSDGGTGRIYINGATITPKSLEEYWFCYPCAITPDDTRMAGTVNNTESGKNLSMYVPFYCDIAQDGTVGEAIMLPYPKTDLVGQPVKYVTAVWISGDGKTILGEVNDDMGSYFYPIIYQQDEAGEWSYSLPTKDLFNPNHIELPANPWANEPEFPLPEDFMSPNARDKYLEEMQAGKEPDPRDFMTQEEIDEYNEAAETYNKWLDSLSSEIKKYEAVYFQILDDSYQFPLNEIVLGLDGKTLLSTAVKINKIDDETFEEVHYLYVYDIENEEGKFIDSMNWVQPHQILSDGTILANYPLINTYSQLSPSSFVIRPGASELIPFLDYCKEEFPEVSSWIEENLKEGTGVVSMSMDKSVIVGSYDVFNLGLPDPDPEVVSYSYIFKDQKAGIDSVTLPDDGNYKVYNLQGVNVLNTKDASRINDLPSGIYVINGKKYQIKH